MKLSQTAKRRIKGSISILLIIILVPMMAFVGVIVDTSRLNMAKSMLSSAGDLALNSALADYDTILKDVYGLFAMSQNKEDLAGDIKNYFAKTVAAQGVVPESESEDYVENLFGDFNELLNGNYSDNITNLMKMDMDASSIVVSPVKNSSLSNPEILRKQIVEYMKFRGPVNIGMGFFDALKSFESVEDQSKVVEKKVEAEEAVQDTTDACATAIKDIRAFDKKFEEINSSVKGVWDIDDGNILTIANYAEQLNHYVKGSGAKSIDVSGKKYYRWFSSYGKLKLIYELMIQKAPEPTHYMLHSLTKVGMVSAKKLIEGTQGAYKITDNYTGVTVSTVTPSNSDDAWNKFNAKVGESGTYLNYFEQYNQKSAIFPDQNVVGRLLGVCIPINYEAEIALSTNEAKEYIAFEHFLLSDEKAEVKYSDIEKAITYLYELKRDYANYYNAIEKDLVEPRNIVTVLEGLANEVDILSTYEGKHEKLIKDLDAALKAKPYDAAKVEQIERDINTLDTKRANAEKKLKSEGYEDLVTDPSAYEGKLKDARDVVTELENKQISAYGIYSNTLGSYQTPTDKYIENLGAYAEIHGNMIFGLESGVTDTYKQFNQIITNLKTLEGLLGTIESDLDNVVTAVASYDKKVGAWSTANDTYEKSHSSDSFSINNAMDIEEAKTSISADEVKKLKQYVTDQKKLFSDFINHIENSETYLYAGMKLYEIEDDDTIYGGAKSTKKALFDNSQASVVESVISDYSELRPALDSHDQGVAYDSQLTDHMYFLKKTYDPTGNQEIYNPASECTFLSYLNATYPDKSTQSEADKTAEADYETFKTNVDADNSGKEMDATVEKTESDNNDLKSSGSEATKTDKFGYTYKSADSSVLSSLSSKTGDTSDTKKAMNINTKAGDKGDRIDASSGVKEQTSGLGSVLNGIKNVASSGLEDMYILQYIFDNFSYNTIVQDRIVKEKKASGLEAISKVNNADNIKAAQKKLKTLSGFEISSNNNYLNGAEIEYILYGKTDAANNVTSAKASIYAIRMVFNTIYAFTNTEIRNETRAAGLAVQAATLGFVPYQVVMIVLQLALAAAESGIDLTAMGNGMKVAVVKTKDTWVLSISSGLKAAGNAVGDLLADAACSAIDKVSGKLQEVMDATASELSGKIESMTSDVSVAINDKVQGVVNRSFDYVQAKICSALSELQKTDFGPIINGKIDGKAEVKKKIDEVFKTYVDDKLATIIDDCFKDAPELAKKLYAESGGAIKTALQNVSDEVKKELKNKIDAAPLPPNAESISGLISDTINKNVIDLKQKMLDTANKKINGLASTVESTAKTYIDEAKDQLSAYKDQAANNLKEDVSTEIKDKVSNYTNSFLDEYVTKGKIPVESGYEPSDTGSVAELIKFGYKDYLMMFTFLGILVNDNGILGRTADIIELNMKTNSAAKGSQFYHKKGSEFVMANAYTYVTINAEVKFSMLLMGNEFLQKGLLVDEGESVADVVSEGSKLKYFGLSGY